METSCQDVFSYTLKSFLPYLWGMETPLWHTVFLSLDFRSYRTYEEWKPRDKRKTIFSNVSSYRTYEEWKLCPAGWTYEKDCVLTVPMRNGNTPQCTAIPVLWESSYRTYEEWKLTWFGGKNKMADKFLPYLWGMETERHKGYYSHAMAGSYRTYEEWKHITIKI